MRRWQIGTFAGAEVWKNTVVRIFRLVTVYAEDIEKNSVFSRLLSQVLKN